MGQRFDGKVAIITGAAKGMGKKTAVDLAAEGCTVVISDIDRKSLDTAVNEIRTKGGKVKGVYNDISIREQVDGLINGTQEEFGRIDILINNAGLLLPGTIEETTDDIIDRTLDINVKGVLYAIRAITPIMKKQMYGDNSTVFVYGASKGAVISLTRSVARQLGPFGVTCNAIAPHAVMTAMMQYWDDEKKKSIADKIPVRRLGTEEDMSYLMCFLASDESSFINGEVININGGYYMD